MQKLAMLLIVLLVGCNQPSPPPAPATHPPAYFTLRIPSCLDASGRDGITVYYPSSCPELDATPLGVALYNVYANAHVIAQGQQGRAPFGRYQEVVVNGITVSVMIPSSIPACVDQRYPLLTARLREAYALAQGQPAKAYKPPAVKVQTRGG